MAATRVENVPHFDFEVGEHGPEDLRVLRFHGIEGISELYRYDLDLASTDQQIDFDSVVGKDATLTWRDREGDHWVHGIVCRFEQMDRGASFSNYRARLVPKVWALTLRHQCRIFQNVSIPDILKEVLNSAGASDLYKFRLKGSFKPREYCVQYRESDWNFLSRLAEEEGIYYFFEQTEDGHKLILGNSPAAHESTPNVDTLLFREPGFGAPEKEHVSRFRFAQQIRHGSVMFRDFDFKKPSLSLEAAAEGDAETDLEFYDYPGEYFELAAGKDLATVRLQEFRAERHMGMGEGNCVQFIPGYKFFLEEHPRADFNQEYLLLRVQHWGNQPQAAEEDAASLDRTVYHNSFECIPAGVTYRPRRWTPRPRVEGPQTAIVVGPSGEEIHTDEYGRVKVHFHWDRKGAKDEKASCWIRVSQGWGGAGWGMVIIPRIGHEVVVDFLEGDPDRPLITGRVYNGENPPPYGLPGAKTVSSFKSNTSPGGGGSNELRFEDIGGSEEIYLHGQKDWNIVIEHDKTQKIGHDETRSVGNDESVTIGHDETWHVVNDRNKTVDKNQSEKIGVDKKIDVGSNHTETIGASKTLKVGSNHTETIGADMTITVNANLKESVAAQYTESVGSAMQLTIGADYTQKVTGGKTVTVGGNESVKVSGSGDESVAGAKQIKIGEDLTEAVGGTHAETTTGDFSLISKKTIAVEAKGDSISIRNGKSSIVMTKGGDVTIEAKNITIKASSKINIQASSDITMKGKNILEN